MYESANGNAFGMAFFILAIAFYFYFAVAQYKIAQKVHHSNAWWAFIPILNMFQLVQMAGKEWYWLLFLLVPVVNIVVLAILWAETARACYKSWVWGVLNIFPLVNIVSMGVMAFTSPSTPSHFPPHHDREERKPAGVA